MYDTKEKKYTVFFCINFKLDFETINLLINLTMDLAKYLSFRENFRTKAGEQKFSQEFKIK